MTFEEFGLYHDESTVDQTYRLVELHRPDGVPDILQQIEQGVLAVLSGYQSHGRIYRFLGRSPIQLGIGLPWGSDIRRVRGTLFPSGPARSSELN